MNAKGLSMIRQENPTIYIVAVRSCQSGWLAICMQINHVCEALTGKVHNHNQKPSPITLTTFLLYVYLHTKQHTHWP